MVRAALAAAGSVAAYGVLIGARRVEITDHRVPLAGLPAALTGLRVVQLSDFHLGPFFRRRSVRKAVALANGLSPDVVVLTGDFVSRSGIPHLGAAQEFRSLEAPLGVFACLGNHDYWEGAEAVRAALEAAGVRVLMNENVHLADGLRLAAVDDLISGSPDLGRATAGLEGPGAVVLLSHNPMVLPRVADRPWLVLSGHTHGGQIALPFLGPRGMVRFAAVRAFMRFYESLGARMHGGRLDAIATWRYPAGWYAEGRARLYVNRGLGVGDAAPVRLNCPPEIARFTLVPRP